MTIEEEEDEKGATTPVKIRKLNLRVKELENIVKKVQEKLLATAETVVQLHGIMFTQIACTDLLMKKEIVTPEEIAAHLESINKEKPNDKDTNDENTDQKDS